MDRPYTIRRVRRVLNAKAFTDTIGFRDSLQPDDLKDSGRGSVLCDALGLDTIDNTHYTAVQRMFGLPKLKASLRDQEGAGRTIEIFTGLVLEMISSGRWGMQKWGRGWRVL
ncbi:BQ5605_C126g13335 [Microbotryum silenes-dioicae]|uniref:BQ5605_C126g13335 protein n=1 Tax=Microbotryum silenes-dioicae TaxID=796604 RepID=A0A2X0NUX3_9BASI|nr:BQ5605_C126g13335 [Microbotryum silenes-dioicae]